VEQRRQQSVEAVNPLEFKSPPHADRNVSGSDSRGSARIIHVILTGRHQPRRSRIRGHQSFVATSAEPRIHRSCVPSRSRLRSKRSMEVLRHVLLRV
jgi:hypothetical protein